MRHCLIVVLFLCLMSQARAQEPENYPPHSTAVRVDSTNLPIVFIEVGGKMILKDDKITARMKIISNSGGQWNYADTIAHPGQRIDYNGYISIKYRGNTSFTVPPKKSYTIRTLEEPLEEGGKKQKVKIMGMNKDNNWALIATYSDRSMVRNLLCYELARPFVEFSPTGKYCEVFLDGTYYGLYTMIEKVTKGKYRLDLEDPGQEGDMLTGDYLLEIDRTGELGFTSKYFPLDSDGNEVTTAQKNVYRYSHPDADEITRPQISYIRNSVWQMEESLVEGDAESQITGEDSHIDALSFADYTLTNEFARNVDAYRFSTNIYRRKDSDDPRFKLAVWDMDLTLGCATQGDGYKADAWVYDWHKVSWIMLPRWVDALLGTRSFKGMMRDRWKQYRSRVYTEENVYAVVDSLAARITEGGAHDRNAAAWRIYGVHLWPNYYDAPDYEHEISYIKQWIKERIDFMDRELLIPTELGDVNGDGQVDVMDVSATTSFILDENPPRFYKSAADINGDEMIDVVDVSAIIDIVLGVMSHDGGVIS